MNRRGVIVGALTVAAIAIASPSAADGPTFDLEPTADEDGRIGIVAEVLIERTLELERVASSTGPRYIAVPRGEWVTDIAELEGNYGWCRGTAWQQVADGADDADIAAARASAEEQFEIYYTREASLRGLALGQVDWNLPCPFDPADALPQEVIDAAVRDAAFEQLPRPEVSIPPGFGLPGLRMYLVTGDDHALTYGPTTFDLDLEVVQLTVDLTATGHTEVDWGDGTVTTHHTPGTAYPHGQVTHVWTHADTYDVTVTDVWTVDYDAGVVSGQVTGRLDPVVLAGFEVRERRAVRTR